MANQSYLSRRACRLFDDAQLYRWIADHALLADLAAAGFELRLDEGHHVATPAQERWDTRKDVPERDERHIDGDDIDERRHITRLQRARVGAFDDHDTRIVPETPVELTVADVERHHACGAALQQHISESASGRADVERLSAGDRDTEGVERVGELETAPADIRMVRFLEGDVCVCGNLLAGFLCRLAIDENNAGQNECGCALPRLRQPALDKKLIESAFQFVLFTTQAAMSARRDS